MGNKSSKKKNQYQYQIPANAEKPYPPSKPSFECYDDDSVYVEWNAPQWTGGCPLIGFVLQFKTLKEVRWTSTEPIAETSCWLKNLQLGQIYNFRVIAENLIGYSVPSELSDEMLVTLENIAPSILSELQDISVLEFERVEFIARATGRPRPTFTWFSNGLEIIPAPHIILNGSKLIVKQIPKKMNGQLKCVIENDYGYRETVCKVTVGVPPRIIIQQSTQDSSDDIVKEPNTRHYFCRVGEMLRLKLKVEGNPEPKLQWTHNGRVIDTQSETLLMGSWATLKIDNIKREDRGEYELWVENEYGQDAAAVLVTVADRPAPLKSPPGIHLQRDDSCLIEWGNDSGSDGIADDGGCPITTYIVEYYRVGWDVWLTAVTTRNKSARIRELIPGSKYSFRVKCENPYGVSDPSPSSNPLFIPELSAGLMSTLAEETGSKMDITEEDEIITTITKLESRPLKHEIKPPTPTTFNKASLSPSDAFVRRSPSPVRPNSPSRDAAAERRPSLMDHYFTKSRGSLQTSNFPTDYVTNTLLTPDSNSTAGTSAPQHKKPSAPHLTNYIYETDSEPEDGKSENEDESEVVEVKSSLTLFKSGNCSIKMSKEELVSSTKTSRTSLVSGVSSGDIAADGLSKENFKKSAGDVQEASLLNRRNFFSFGKTSDMRRSENSKSSGELPSKDTESLPKSTTPSKQEPVVEELPVVQANDRLLINSIGLILLILSFFVKYLNFGLSVGLLGFVLYKLCKL